MQNGMCVVLAAVQIDSITSSGNFGLCLDGRLVVHSIVPFPFIDLIIELRVNLVGHQLQFGQPVLKFETSVLLILQSFLQRRNHSLDAGRRTERF